MTEHTLTLDRLTKQYGEKLAVDRVSCTLHQGVYGLLGNNGAGKTTLLRMICDVLTPTSGEVYYDGVSTRKMGEQYREILGYLPQHFGYYPGFTPVHFMTYLATLKGIPKQIARARTEALLDTVGLSDVRNKRIRTFSGGMIQRLGIAQALLGDPELLILDEPTTGIDPGERIRFRELIRSLGKERIVLLSTHIVSDLEQAADGILIMRRGQLVYQGAIPDDVVSLERMYLSYFEHEGEGI